jgi:hypothetical protein
MGLRLDGNARVREDPLHEVHRTLPEAWPCGATDGEKFGEDFIGGPEVVFSKGAAEVEGLAMPVVSRTEERHPVEGIGEEMPHAGFFGVP